MKVLVVGLALLLSGCGLMPSKWDVNQAHTITDARIHVDAIDCNKDVSLPLKVLATDLNWLHTYSTYKGTTDLDQMVVVVQNTVTQFQTSVDAKQSSMVYCQLKKALITQQIDIIGHTIKGSLP